MALLGLCLLGLLFSPGAKAAGATAVGWGANIRGNIGTGATTPADINVPEPVKGLAGVTQIAAGGVHSLALLGDGTVMAWGDNSEGELGDGTASGPDCPSTDCRATPAPVPRLPDIVAVAAGVGYSLALLADGTVMAWGDNTDGQLGNGDTSGPETCGTPPFTVSCSTLPIRVPGLANVVAVSANRFDNLALLADGTVTAWGFDEQGESGNGTGTQNPCGCVDEPTPVKGVVGAMAISAGGFGGLALLGDGTVKSWGDDVEGELGNGTMTPLGGCSCLGPVSVSGLAGVQSVVAGGFHSLAMVPGGGLQSWGENADGQLGQDVFDSCNCSPTPAPVVGLSGPTAIAGGEFHSLALLANGAVKAWGANNEGEIGDQTLKNREIPTAVREVGGTGVLTGASAVAAGGATSFALIGPSQTLKITLAGAGSGAVGGPGILCPPGCEAHYPQGQVENLRAEAKPGSGFAGFSNGPCGGTATICRVRLDQDQSLTATFGPPKGTAITKATVINRRKSASFSFTAPGAITGFQCELIRPRPSRHAKARKAPKPSFSACTAPIAYRHLTPGRYAFRVRALDVLGADASPALRKFTIRARRARRARGHR
jgi:alpha-tubulin suppressor-like RCC1 family protein